MNETLKAVLEARAEHFTKLAADLRKGLREQGLEPTDNAIVEAALQLYGIDDDERNYGDG